MDPSFDTSSRFNNNIGSPTEWQKQSGGDFSVVDGTHGLLDEVNRLQMWLILGNSGNN